MLQAEISRINKLFATVSSPNEKCYLRCVSTATKSYSSRLEDNGGSVDKTTANVFARTLIIRVKLARNARFRFTILSDGKMEAKEERI